MTKRRSSPARRRDPVLRYRCPTADGGPPIGTILMGHGPRVRKAYRVIGVVQVKGKAALGMITFRLTVERMSADRGKEEIVAGAPSWTIVWDRRERRRNHG